jgi:hypothetical protein
MNVFQKIGNFLSCLLHENCEYSIKKILAYIFSAVVIYLAIFTDKGYYEMLIFVGALLGIRGYERVKLWGGNPNPTPPEDPEPSGGLSDGSPLGASKKDKRLLTD